MCRSEPSRDYARRATQPDLRAANPTSRAHISPPLCQAAGDQVGQVAVESAHGLGSQAHELVATVGQESKRHRPIVGANHRQPWRLEADHRDGVRVGVVGLASVAAGVDADQRGAASGDIHNGLVLGHETLGQVLAYAVASLDRPRPGRHRRENVRSSRKPLAVFENC
jgi:hypothetical protein